MLLQRASQLGLDKITVERPPTPLFAKFANTPEMRLEAVTATIQVARSTTDAKIIASMGGWNFGRKLEMKGDETNLELYTYSGTGYVCATTANFSVGKFHGSDATTKRRLQ